MSYQPRTGMRVACIRSDYHPSFDGPDMPRRGSVYTIRAIAVVPEEFEGCDVGLRFVEIAPKSRFATGGEWWFPANCFRPLDERRLDVFREALKKAPAPRERVEA